MTKEYPRVLIISPNILNPIGRGSVLISNLFEGWPREKIADIYSQQHIHPNEAVCANYYKLYARIASHPSEWCVRALDYMRGRSETLEGIASIRITSRLRQWLEMFKPQLVYSHLGPLWLTRLTNMVVNRLDIPLVVHIMDDYILDWPVNGVRRRNIFPFASILHYLNDREFLESLKLAKLRLTISDAMSREYEKRYNYRFGVVYNGVNPTEWPSRERRALKEDESFSILYSGVIAENRDLFSLRSVARAVASLAAKGLRIQMRIACPRELASRFRRDLEYAPYVEFVDMVSRTELPRRFAEFDLLLMPYNFDSGAIRLFQYSWPGRLPEYMASGTAILMCAPSSLTFVEYALREKCAYVVDTQTQSDIETALLRLASDTNLRSRIAATARQVALKDHDLERIRLDFQQAIRNLAFS